MRFIEKVIDSDFVVATRERGLRMEYTQPYFHLSFRENFYLFVFIILIGMLLCAFIAGSHNFFMRHPVVKLMVEVAVFNTLIYSVFVFLKPVSQFIYFQFYQEDI